VLGSVRARWGVAVDLNGKLLGALLLTYFVSRLTMRLPSPLRGTRAVALAHGLAFAAIALLLFVLRGPSHAFDAEQMLVYVSPQVLWWLLDLLRARRVGLKVMAGGSGEKAPKHHRPQA
jgi:hypothetical protein